MGEAAPSCSINARNWLEELGKNLLYKNVRYRYCVPCQNEIQKYDY